MRAPLEAGEVAGEEEPLFQDHDGDSVPYLWCPAWRAGFLVTATTEGVDGDQASHALDREGLGRLSFLDVDLPAEVIKVPGDSAGGWGVASVFTFISSLRPMLAVPNDGEPTSRHRALIRL